MDCRAFKELLDSFLSDELKVETNHAILWHAERCATCRAEMEARQRLRVLLRRIRDNSQTSAEFHEQLRERLRLEVVAEKTSGARGVSVFLRLFARRHR
jgi:predicted anti-sigma-YlaC factor YlaD